MSEATAPSLEWPDLDEWTVPGYAEERLLGRGVSGRVVAAVNKTTGQRVAIKYFDDNLLLARHRRFSANSAPTPNS